jgi:predicted component of type VI protein secretion system
MAEIRSTLDMVMERAAKIAAETEDRTPAEDGMIKGMQLAAAFLNHEEQDLAKLLGDQPPEQQMGIRGGMAKTLLRNIILPRGESVSEQSLVSLQSLEDLSGNSGDIATICAEIRQILEQYGQHLEQVKQQFDESILGQLKMKLQEQGLGVDDQMALNPTMHPQYQEEWSRVVADLNGQYNEALDQRKNLIAQRFST